MQNPPKDPLFFRDNCLPAHPSQLPCVVVILKEALSACAAGPLWEHLPLPAGRCPHTQSFRRWSKLPCKAGNGFDSGDIMKPKSSMTHARRNLRTAHISRRRRPEGRSESTLVGELYAASAPWLQLRFSLGHRTKKASRREIHAAKQIL